MSVCVFEILHQMKGKQKSLLFLFSVDLTDDGVKAIYQFASGDMRKSINLLQSTSMSSKTVDGPSVYACVAYPSPAEVRSLLDHVLNEPISTAYHSKLPR
ncbi:uncharacterized protein DC041_0008862 [Schistosoma bovis]|uniref:Uncharacterized protein n=1 Tax=Schistosoma bovis TaxID=6184 RepID=A0A430QT83_SCHBO|nr:uncharacterized protein DC041_0008862 [Schistosoma bovis]